LGYGAGFCVRQPLNGGGHDAARVVATFAGFPAVNLLQRIGDGLARDDGLTRACALSGRAVTGGAGGDSARGVSRKPDGGWWGRGAGHDGWRGKARVPGGDSAAAVLIQTTGDARHDVVGPQAAGIVLHLLLQIALIQTGEARDGVSVAFAFQPMTGEAGVCRSARAAAHGDQFAGSRKGAVSSARRGVACREQQAE
jgi:hypothetical protein